MRVDCVRGDARANAHRVAHLLDGDLEHRGAEPIAGVVDADGHAEAQQGIDVCLGIYGRLVGRDVKRDQNTVSIAVDCVQISFVPGNDRDDLRSFLLDKNKKTT